MRQLVSTLAILLTLAISIDIHAQCKSGPPSSPAYDPDANLGLNDYARIHMDAENPACAQNAMYALYHKLHNHMWLDAQRTQPRPGAFSSWLDGYLVALIYASALRLGALGWATKDLDQLLLTQPGQHPGLDSFFAHAGQPTGPGSSPCAFGSFNTCMDDYTGTAAAYAWMAAYKERRGQPSAADRRQDALDYFDAAMASVCIWTPHTDTTSPLCNRNINDADAQTLTVNQGQQQIPYGFGLMTSIASTWLGVRASGGSLSFSPDQKKIATGLFSEAQRRIDASIIPPLPLMPRAAEFRDDCLSETPVNGQRPFNQHCGGAGRYKPNMYQLREFYQAAEIPIPADGNYASDSFDENHFSIQQHHDEFMGFGRFVTYGTHGQKWVVNVPDFMPHDNYNPIGFFEGISPSGVAQGWTCDPDTAEIQNLNDVRGVWVDFYADVVEFPPEGSGFADSPSEDPINDACPGNTTKHRFWVQLPESTRGKVIRAFGLDYTWYGFTELPCLQTPQCSW